MVNAPYKNVFIIIIIIIINIKFQNEESGSRIKCHRVTMHVSNARKTKQNALGIQRQLTKLDNRTIAR